MRPLGGYLNERGFTISALLLPGHGTEAEDLNRCQWPDWVEHVEQELSHLQTRCERVFVAGISMGALLALHLAPRHGELAGAILCSPAITLADPFIYLTPVLKYLLPIKSGFGNDDLTDPQAGQRLWGYGKYPLWGAHELLKLQLRVRRILPQVTCPLLIVHSTGDQIIGAHCGRYTYQRVASEDKELVILHNSGHVVTADSEWEFVAEKTYMFIKAGAL